MTKQIPLFGKHGSGKFAVVDDEDYDKVKDYRWFLAQDGSKRNYYTVKTTISKNGKLHNLKMGYVVLGELRIGLVDHKNGDVTDNRKENLRCVTPTQSMCNRGGCETSTSKYKGVSWDTNRQKWICVIVLDRKLFNLGRYDDEILAAKNYDYYAIRFHGEFARLNFPEHDYSNFNPKRILNDYTLSTV